MKKIINRPALKQGDLELFESLVKSNMKRAYYAALGIIGSHDAAMELSQEAFIRAYRHFGKFDRTKKFFTWYYKILRNLCLNFIRDSKKKVGIEFLDYTPGNQDENDPQTILEKREMQQKLEQAISMLDFNDKELLILKEFESYTYKEISELLGIPIGTVMSRLFYARKKLAEKMEGLL